MQRKISSGMTFIFSPQAEIWRSTERRRVMTGISSLKRRCASGAIKKLTLTDEEARHTLVAFARWKNTSDHLLGHKQQALYSS
jgi:hypothetical protein